MSLKIRIMPTLLYRGHSLVKGIGFDSWRHVGTAIPAVKVYNMRGVDELVFVDISASRDGRSPDFALIDDLADECFMPLTVGGGIRSVNDVQDLLWAGADKVSINSAFYHKPKLVADVAKRFGSQCVVVSLDVHAHADGRCEVVTHSGTMPTGESPITAAKRAEAEGAGEILLTSIVRDGTMEGYDVDLVASVCAAVNIPVIASGGAGKPEHMEDVLKNGGASAVAAASMFHFTHQTPRDAKLYLHNKGFPIRLA